MHACEKPQRSIGFCAWSNLLQIFILLLRWNRNWPVRCNTMDSNRFRCDCWRSSLLQQKLVIWWGLFLRGIFFPLIHWRPLKNWQVINGILTYLRINEHGQKIRDNHIYLDHFGPDRTRGLTLTLLRCKKIVKIKY